MKSLQEKINMCKSCLKRSFDPNTGVICSLTKAKPTFDDVCLNYEQDPTIKALEEAKEKVEKKRAATEPWISAAECIVISGITGCWTGGIIGGILGGILGGIIGYLAMKSKSPSLFVFLWVGIASFGILTILSCDLLTIICASPILVIAVYTIVAFYRRRSNAVALAKTFSAMVIIDGISAFIMYLIVNGHLTTFQGIQNLIWGAILFSFLMYSVDVKNMFPPSTRTYKLFEKILLAIFIGICISLITLTIEAN